MNFARIWCITNLTAARRVSPPWIVYMAKLTPTERITTKLCTQAHVPTPRYGQYLRHAHNHITPAVAAMDSCFALIGAHQHGKALGSMGGGKTRASKTFWSIFSSHLHTHAVGEPFCGSQPTDTTCLRWSWRLMKCFALDSAVKGLKCVTRRLQHAGEPQRWRNRCPWLPLPGWYGCAHAHGVGMCALVIGIEEITRSGRPGYPPRWVTKPIM